MEYYCRRTIQVNLESPAPSARDSLAGADAAGVVLLAVAAPVPPGGHPHVVALAEDARAEAAWSDPTGPAIPTLHVDYFSHPQEIIFGLLL